MSDTDNKLDEILQELANTVYRHGKATRTNTPFHYGEPIKEAKQAIKQLIVDEFEELIGEDDKYDAMTIDSDYDYAARNQLKKELRQKLKEWKDGYPTND